MRRLVCHSLFVTAALLGADGYFNEGRDTESLLRAVSGSAAVQQAELQGYHFNANIQRQLAVLTPAVIR